MMQEAIDENAVALLSGTGPAHKIVSGPWGGGLEGIDLYPGLGEPLALFRRGTFIFVLSKNEHGTIDGDPLYFLSATVTPLGDYNFRSQGRLFPGHKEQFLDEAAAKALLLVAPILFPGVKRPAVRLPSASDDNQPEEPDA